MSQKENDISLWSATNETANNPCRDKLNQTGSIESSDQGGTSMIQGELPSIYFKPGPSQPHDEEEEEEPTSTSSTDRRVTWTVNQVNNPFDVGGNELAMQAALANEFTGTGGGGCGGSLFPDVTFSQFRDADEFQPELDKEEALNRREFADNNLTLNHSTAATSSSTSPTERAGGHQQQNRQHAGESDKWWLTADQMLQASKLEVSANSSQLLFDAPSHATSKNDSQTNTSSSHVRIPAVDYFTKRSNMPDICRTESDVQMDDTVVMTGSTSNNNHRRIPASLVAATNRESSSGQVELHNETHQADRTLCEDKEPIINIFVSFFMMEI